jgi:hypothetical protein
VDHSPENTGHLTFISKSYKIPSESKPWPSYIPKPGEYPLNLKENVNHSSLLSLRLPQGRVQKTGLIPGRAEATAWSGLEPPSTSHLRRRATLYVGNLIYRGDGRTIIRFPFKRREVTGKPKPFLRVWCSPLETPI